jgi:hypothetical protein
MPLSRADLESLIALRHGALMRLVGFDTTTVDGTNLIMGLAIGGAIRSMGLPVSSPLNPSDADLAGVDAVHMGEFLDDRLPLAVREMIIDNWDQYNERENTTGQDKGSLLNSLLTFVESKRKFIESTYAAGETVSAPVSGVRCDVPACPCPSPYPGSGYQSSRWV